MLASNSRFNQTPTENHHKRILTVEFVNRVRLARFSHSSDPIAAAIATSAIVAIEMLKDAGGDGER